jgi:uncharacterized phage protein (TIGR02216 family)
MAQSKPFPWDEVTAFAFKVLGLSPAEFWSLTPRELALAMEPFARAQGAPSRHDFETLCNSFPDEEI